MDISDYIGLLFLPSLWILIVLSWLFFDLVKKENMDRQSIINIASPFIASIEGYESTAYWDNNGYAIGFGNHYYADGTAVQKGDTITRAGAETLLPIVVAGKWDAIAPYIKVPITNGMGAALTSLAYNWGEGNVRDSIVLKLINSQASGTDIAKQFSITAITSSGIENDDLIARRLKEIQLFFSTDTGKGIAAAFIILGFVGIFYFTKGKVKL